MMEKNMNVDDFLEEVFEKTNWKETLFNAYKAAQDCFAQEMQRIAQEKRLEGCTLKEVVLLTDEVIPACYAVSHAVMGILRDWQSEKSGRDTDEYEWLIDTTAREIAQKAISDLGAPSSTPIEITNPIKLH